MHAGTTSLAPANSTRGEWSQFATFLKRPVLPARAPMPRLASLAAVLRLFLLDVLVMAALLAVAGAVMSSGIEVPKTALADMEIGADIALAVIFFAPLAEEFAFRGWLSGRPGHLLAVLLGSLVALGMTVLLFATATGPAESMGTIGPAALKGGTAGLVVAGLTVFLLRDRDAMGWFQRLFPLLFWLSAVGFASVHLFNFKPEEMMMALPLVLPQFVTGTILGYLRVNYGLWASVLLHALHNGAFIGLVLLAGSSA
ncbi:CPBP family intramembrane metalloprotease [Qipengyuania sp. YG27]|uniref:CPBP family intramembrane metalloprotease n=1 Tax=Qipengyuania mesophila TaxID=2867246 RepID=A0ABS7JTV3_9SPHN|nr:CPBP family glutamic-type intramembrane protease [Qipengyuania mesophila]MBX7501003.1 CPBP family intramembrane metalloprotease [Qipengyuania mesophila]